MSNPHCIILYFNHLWGVLCVVSMFYPTEADVQGADGADAAKLCLPFAQLPYGLPASQGK